MIGVPPEATTGGHSRCSFRNPRGGIISPSRLPLPDPDAILASGLCPELRWAIPLIVCGTNLNDLKTITGVDTFQGPEAVIPQDVVGLWRLAWVQLDRRRTFLAIRSEENLVTSDRVGEVLQVIGQLPGRDRSPLELLGDQ